MYNEFHDIEDLYAEVAADKTISGANAYRLNRYPIRFVMFDNFRDAYDFACHLQDDMGVKVKDVASWMDAEYPDLLMTHQRLSEHIAMFIKKMGKVDYIIAPFSELARFYDNSKNKIFESLIKTLKGIEASSDAWKHNQRVYIPIVGLENKMSFFAKDSMVEAWYFRNTNRQLDYRLIVTDGNDFGVKSLEKKYTFVKDIHSWLKIWSNPDANIKKEIISTSHALYGNAMYAQPDNAFFYDICHNAYEFLTKGLRLDFGDIIYKKQEDVFWDRLAGDINVDNENFSLDSFARKYFGVNNFTDCTVFLRAWFEHSEIFERWFLIKYYIYKFEGKGYLCHVLNSLEGFTDKDLFTAIALNLASEVSSEVEERRCCLSAAACHGVILPLQIEHLLQSRLNAVAEQKGYDIAIKYFSSLTNAEKKLAIAWVGKGLVTKKQIKRFYPELFEYLNDLQVVLPTEVGWIEGYINKYKKTKIEGRYSEEISNIIKHYNADAPSFLKWYNSFKTTYTQLVSRTDIDVLFWIDGLGIDWIPLISAIIRNKEHEGVYLNEVSIARALLPTVTSVNKTNLQKLGELDKEGDLDGYAHTSHDFFIDSIIEEINIVKNSISDILQKYGGKKIAIVSDHGMTYLSQYVNGLNLAGVESDHNGRLAISSQAKVVSDNNYLILDDGKTLVALRHNSLCKKVPSGQGAHGGCTPEEVLVPIFIISPNKGNMHWDASMKDVHVSAQEARAHLIIEGFCANETAYVEYNGSTYNISHISGKEYITAKLDLVDSVKQLKIHIGSNSKTLFFDFTLGAKEDDLFSF